MLFALSQVSALELVSDCRFVVLGFERWLQFSGARTAPPLITVKCYTLRTVILRTITHREPLTTVTKALCCVRNRDSRYKGVMLCSRLLRTPVAVNAFNRSHTFNRYALLTVNTLLTVNSRYEGVLRRLESLTVDNRYEGVLWRLALLAVKPQLTINTPLTVNSRYEGVMRR